MIALLAFSRQGCRTARKIQADFTEEVQLYAPEKLGQKDFAPTASPLSDFVGPLFRQAGALIFVGSVGIAVRAIAPHVRDKRTDPAVLAVDELGHFVIPLLSGHIGGANALANRLAASLGATSVVTTATDINGRFSVDAWAASHGYVLSDMGLAKEVSAAILEREIPISSVRPPPEPLPPGLVAGETGELGIRLSCREEKPYDHTLLLIPRVLTLGIGCRRGTSKEAIAQAVEAVFQEAGLRREAAAEAVSIDLKKDEEGLIAYCREAGLPLSFASAEELRQVPGDFTPSEFVRRVTGVDNVCERAALLKGGNLIVKKTARAGITVAVAERNWEVSSWEK